jgi:hypothetical protein
MKKLLIIIGICILLVGMPLTTAVFSQKIKHHPDTQILSINKPILTTDTPPDWATGYFVGVIGMTNSTGYPQPHRGIVAGYCSDDFKGRFAGVIAKNTESEPIGYTGGYIRIPFMFGIIGNISSKKQISMVGLGVCNETHFYLRIMTLVGPTFYMAGKYSPL